MNFHTASIFPMGKSFDSLFDGGFRERMTRKDGVEIGWPKKIK